MNLYQELVTANLRTTSRIIAEKFGKPHKNILRIIEQVIEQAPEAFGRLNFEPTSYLDSRGKKQPMYELTRQGFMLVVMGLTGTEALAWKIRFLEAFDLMEAELRRRGDLIPAQREVLPDEYERLTPVERARLVAECRMIRGKVAADDMWHRLRLLPMLGGTISDGASAEDEGFAALDHLLEHRRRSIIEAREARRDDLRHEGLAIRREGLLVANIGPSVFDGTRWEAGAHRAALRVLPGVKHGKTSTYFDGKPSRFLIIPWSLVDGEDGL